MTPLNVIFALVFIGIFFATYRSCEQLGKRMSVLIILGTIGVEWVFTLFSYTMGYRMMMTALTEAMDEAAHQEFKTRAMATLNQSLVVSLVITIAGFVFLLLVARKIKKASVRQDHVT